MAFRDIRLKEIGEDMGMEEEEAFPHLYIFFLHSNVHQYLLVV